MSAVPILNDRTLWALPRVVNLIETTLSTPRVFGKGQQILRINQMLMNYQELSKAWVAWQKVNPTE